MFYLKQLVGSTSSFPYNLGTAYDCAFGEWTHFEGTSKDDNSPVSVFRFSAGRSDHAKLQAARNGVKRLKMLRHPGILAFKSTLEVEEKGDTVIYLVTENVKPLTTILESLDISEEARREYIAMGLHQVSRAVSFLNNDCKLIHGGLGLEAVVVTPQLDWRLSGFDLLSEHSSVTSYDSSLRFAPSLVSQARRSAEIGKEDWEAIAQSPPWAVDAWGLGCLLQEAFSGRRLKHTEDLRNLDNIPKPIAQDYQRLLASAMTKRLNTSKLAESSTLKNKLVETISFLENLAVKDSAEKDTFFRRLPATIPSVPTPVAQQKLLPMLAGALEFGGAPAVALAAMLQIGKTLEPEEFSKKVVPALSKLFTSTDRSIRRSLLENIDFYGPHLDQATIESQIYPQAATGFGDSNAYLRELTLKSMLILAPKLSQKTINQSLLKYLAKLQVDEEAPIRANTTILLGNLAKHLSEATCKRVLLNAFTRALKDSFPPARTAGLKAMMATAHLHGPTEAAIRVIPAVAPLTVDPVTEVRKTALQALSDFSLILKDHSKLLEDQAAAAGDTTKDTAKDQTGWSAGLMGGSLGWAISTAASMRGSPSDTNLAQAKTGQSVAAAPSNEFAQTRADTDATSTTAGGRDTADDLAEQLSNHGLNGANSRATSIDSRATSYQEARGWQSDDDWGEDEPPQPKVRPHPVSSEGVPPKPPARVPSKRPTATSRQGRGKPRPMKLGAQRLTQKPDVSDISDFL